MRKTMLALPAALTVVVGMATPASAATTQKYCNSSASVTVISVASTNLRPGECTYKGTSALVWLSGKSYRPAYNYGPYRDCRTNYAFDAADSPTVLYFKTYNRSDCTNTIYL